MNPKNIYNYENYDSIKNNPEVDVIYIVLPNGMHAEYTVRGSEPASTCYPRSRWRTLRRNASR